MPPPSTLRATSVLLDLTRAISRARAVEDIYAAALDALAAGLGVERSSILLFDPDGVMRFKAWRGLSPGYRAAVEGHTPWAPDSPDPAPIVLPDVTADPSLGPYLPTIQAEGIGAMGFIPLVSLDRVIGKFMLYYPGPYSPSDAELELASVVAAQVAFAVERTRTEAQALRSEARLRFALDAAAMGTWDWDLATNRVLWSDNLERIHGLPPGTFDGTFESYAREIHPDDRERVFASVQRALSEGVPHEVEYRLVAPDGTIRWCEGKGRVEYHDGRPVRMTGVCVMVTQRKEAEMAKLGAAEEASRLKDEFLAVLSHELRTPLNAILGWVQLLHAGDAPADRTKHAIEVIGRNARLQAQLIEDILDVSRIITGKFELERQHVGLGPLIETVLAGAQPSAQARGITFDVTLPDALPQVDGDPKRLHQVLNNVLSNAVKFSPEGGRVALRAWAVDDSVHVQVSDEGVGIAPEFLPYIFDRFRQADSRATRAHGGLGLGLAIARHLVELHGGAIDAHSEGPGRGTTVTVRLPVASAAAVASPAVAVQDRPPVDLTGLRIAVVDDQPDAREIVGRLLEERGASILLCDSAASVLSTLEREAVDLLIADIAMPGVDGYELIRRVRGAGRDVPAIAVTAYARPEDHRLALVCGYSACCAKPVDGAQLLESVHRVITR